MAAMIRAIRGDIDPAELGPCDAQSIPFLVTPAQPGEEYSDVSKAIEEAKTLRAAGGRALVDWTPIGLGRDLNGLRAVSEATGLHIVAATGVHRDVHYAADDTLRSESEDTLANRFVGDLERCGIIKVGAGYHTITPFEAKGFAAAAVFQLFVLNPRKLQRMRRVFTHGVAPTLAASAGYPIRPGRRATGRSLHYSAFEANYQSCVGHRCLLF
jgi:predicted metal-dependent phosphotriesterase family hydrolase